MNQWAAEREGESSAERGAGRQASGNSPPHSLPTCGALAHRPRALARPLHVALMDAQAATAGCSQDQYSNQHHTEPPALFPTPNWVGGGLEGCREGGEINFHAENSLDE